MISVLEKKIGPFTVVRTIALVGVVLTIAALFLAWLDFGYETTFTGAECLDKMGDHYIKYLPLAIAALGALTAVLYVIDVSVDSIRRFMTLITLAAGIAMILMVALFYTYRSGYLHVTDVAGCGIWVALAGGLLVTLSGVIEAVPKLRS